MTSELTLYSRTGCHLCEDMEAQLQPYLDEAGVSLRLVYIDNNSQLEQEYGSLVPVLKSGDEEICHYFLDKQALTRVLS